MNAVCPMRVRLSSFLSGELDSVAEAEFENHVDSCPACREQLQSLTEDTALNDRLAGAAESRSHLQPRLRNRFAHACEDVLATQHHAEDTHFDGEAPRGADEWPVIDGYKVLDVLGRGGLGVVYRAFDVRLMRPVALKIIRHLALADERERLRREAQALASLQHPNIVRIYEIGDWNDRPYLSLEFVPHGNLARFAAATPQSPATAARLVTQLALAVQAAHHRRLVHRDLKPANILLQWPDDQPAQTDLDQATPKITDFGLVKDTATDSSLTHTRDLLGTPSYMAPEQAGGDATTVGPACDIWALGAILYELLTGRPPFHGTSAVDTLMQVRQADPVAPSRLQPKTPRDLETICLKCLEKSPERRYQSAQLLAADLRRFAEGRPIHARPISLIGKTVRCCRRNPLSAALGAVAALLLIALAIGGPLAAVREASLRHHASEQAERASHNFDLASQALDSTVRHIYVTMGMRPDVVFKMDSDAAQAVIPYLEELVRQTPTTTELHIRKAQAARQLARAMSDLGNNDRAEHLLLEARADLAAQATAFPHHDELRRDLGLCQYEYGRFLLKSNARLTEAETMLRETICSQEALASERPANANLREDLANTCYLLGEKMASLKPRWAEGRDQLTRALQLRAALTADAPNDMALLLSEVFTRLRLGMVLMDLKDNEKAVEVNREAVRLQHKRVELNPADPQMLYVLATIQESYAYSLTRQERWDEAMAAMTESLDLHDRLVAVFPTSPQYAEPAAKAHELCRQMHEKRSAWAAGIEQAAIALRIIERFAKSRPTSRSVRLDMQNAHRLLAEMLRRGGRGAEAHEPYAKSIAMAEVLLTVGNEDRLRRSFALAHVGLGELVSDEGSFATALSEFEQALQILKVIDEPARADVAAVIQRTHRGRAKALAGLGRDEEAKEAATQASTFAERE